MPTDDGDARRELVEACRVLDREGLTGAFGHVSARTADGGALISPRVAPGLVTDPGQIVALDPEGQPLGREATDPPAELWVHLGIYRARTDVGAVVRSHAPAALAYSTLGRPLRSTVAYGAFLGGEVPLHDDPRPAFDADDGAALGASLGDAAALLIRGGGQAVVGVSVAEAIVRTILLERVASAALAAPDGRPLSDEELARFAPTQAVHERQVARVWAYYRARAQS